MRRHSEMFLITQEACQCARWAVVQRHDGSNHLWFRTAVQQIEKQKKGRNKFCLFRITKPLLLKWSLVVYWRQEWHWKTSEWSSQGWGWGQWRLASTVVFTVTHSPSRCERHNRGEMSCVSLAEVLKRHKCKRNHGESEGSPTARVADSSCSSNMTWKGFINTVLSWLFWYFPYYFQYNPGKQLYEMQYASCTVETENTLPKRMKQFCATSNCHQQYCHPPPVPPGTSGHVRLHGIAPEEPTVLPLCPTQLESSIAEETMWAPRTAQRWACWASHHSFLAPRTVITHSQITADSFTQC